MELDFKNPLAAVVAAQHRVSECLETMCNAVYDCGVLAGQKGLDYNAPEKELQAAAAGYLPLQNAAEAAEEALGNAIKEFAGQCVIAAVPDEIADGVEKSGRFSGDKNPPDTAETEPTPDTTGATNPPDTAETEPTERPLSCPFCALSESLDKFSSDAFDSGQLVHRLKNAGIPEGTEEFEEATAHQREKNDATTDDLYARMGAAMHAFAAVSLAERFGHIANLPLPVVRHSDGTLSPLTAPTF